MSMSVKDELVMPNRYSATNLGYGLRYLKKRPMSVQEVSLESAIGGLKTRGVDVSNIGARYREPRANLYWFDLQYFYLHQIPSWSEGKYKVHLGAAADLLVNARYSERWDNSSINYEGAFSPLSFQGQAARDFRTWRKKMNVSFTLNFPIFVYVMRPEFSGVPDFLDHETDFLSSLIATPASGWVGFWDFPRFRTQWDLSLPIAGENFMRFTYRWEYYSYQEPMRTQFGGHSFLFTLFTHL
jgi:hypothetical protein